MKNKLYVLVHPSLPKSKGAAQAGHGVAALALADPHALKEWNNETIVLLRSSYDDTMAVLEKYIDTIPRPNGLRYRITYEMFYDTDLDFTHPTAVAVYPRNDHQREYCEEHFKYLPLL